MYLQYKLRSIVNVESPGCGNPSCGFINKCYIYSLLELCTDCFPSCNHTQALHTVCTITDTRRNYNGLLLFIKELLLITSRTKTYNITNQSPVVAPLLACVKCSNVSSVSSFTAGTLFSVNIVNISSSFKRPRKERCNVNL